jgi:hypothetical protein
MPTLNMCVDFYLAANGGSYDLIYLAISQDDFYTSLNSLTTMGAKRRMLIKPNMSFKDYDNTRIAYAFSVVENRDAAAPGGYSPSAADVTTAKKWLTDQKTKQIYFFTRDVTDTLPAPNPGAPRLSAQDYDTAATEMGIEAAAIHAVADVEAGGRTGFDAQGRPKILFEGHKFRSFTGKVYDLKYPWLSKTYPDSRTFYKWDQWSRIYEAMDLNVEAALKAASWGLFQVMGFNHNGWGSATEFAKAMFVSEYNHLKGFMSFCKDNNLTKYITDHNWATFALKYNGADYATNGYDTKMEAAYKRHTAAAAKKP